MLRITTFIYFLLSVLAAYSQPIRFNKLIKAGDSLTESGNAVVRMPNGNYLIAANTINVYASDSTKHYRICIMQVDSNGKAISQYYIGKKSYAYTVIGSRNVLISDNNGGWVLTANYYDDTSASNSIQNCLLIKLDSNAKISWIKEFTSNEDFTLAGRGIIQSEDHGYVILSGKKRKSDGYTRSVLIKVDSNGNQLWEKSYDAVLGTQHFSPTSFVLLPDKGYAISGITQLINHYYIQVTRTDSLGKVLWNKKYGGDDSYSFIDLLSSGNIVLFGKQSWDAYLAELSLNGDTIFQNISSSLVRLDAYANLFENSDGFTLIGNRYDLTPVHIGDHIVGWIKKMDKAHNTKWQRTFFRHNLYDNTFLSSTRTPDGGYVITGTSFDSTQKYGLADIWLVKTDSFGCDVPGCQLIDGIAPLLPGQGASMQLYPNPANRREPVHLQYLLRKSEQELTVSLTDISGKQVIQIPFYSYATEGSLSMDLSWLKPGIYTVTLQTETGITHQKLLLQ